MAATAGKFGSASVGFLIDGYDITAMKLTGLNLKIEALQEESHGLGQGNQEHTPTGMSRTTLAQRGGFFDTTTGSSHEAFATSVPTSPQATQRVACAWLAGSTIGESFYGCEGILTAEYEVLDENGKLTKANAVHRVSGALDRGTIINALTAKTADWNTKTDGAQVDYTLDTLQRVIPITSNTAANPSVVTTTVEHGRATGDIVLITGVASSSPTINGERTVTVISPTTFSVTVNVTVPGTGGSFVRANTSAGGVGYQQVKDLAGFSGFVGKLRDSPDDITYADLITFTNVTAARAAERVVVAGVIDRFSSYDGNVTGTGSIAGVLAGLSRG